MLQLGLGEGGISVMAAVGGGSARGAVGRGGGSRLVRLHVKEDEWYAI